jgi:hypothetical protein
MYRQVHPRADMSIECNTDKVPNDGKYYVITNGEIIGKFRGLKSAIACYQKLVDEIALPPLEEHDSKVTYENIMDDYYSRISNNTLLGTSFGSKGKKTGRFTKSK